MYAYLLLGMYPAPLTVVDAGADTDVVVATEVLLACGSKLTDLVNTFLVLVLGTSFFFIGDSNALNKYGGGAVALSS